MPKLSSQLTPYLMAGFGVWLGLAGCSAVAPPQGATPSPTVSGEPKARHALSQEEARRLQACDQDQTCDRAHFTSALLALPEN
ncbi:MAG: hypothetical protein ACREJU_02860, partial [Nitrospiraceae bacterium]